MSEILTVEQVAIIRKDPLSSSLIWGLCDGYEALRGQLAEAQGRAQAWKEHDALESRFHDADHLAMQEMEADLRALTEAIREYPEWQAYTNVYAALVRPGVQRVLAKRDRFTSCPACGRTNVHYSIESDMFRCQRCRHVWPAHPGRFRDALEPQGR